MSFSFGTRSILAWVKSRGWATLTFDTRRVTRYGSNIEHGYEKPASLRRFRISSVH